VNKSILSSLTQQVTALAMTRTAVLTDTVRGITYERKNKVFNFTQQPPSNIDVLIVGKEHYSEENRSFPIQSSRELNKILSLEAANSSDILLYSIGPYEEGERQVICWKIKSLVLTQRQLKPLLIVPESALLLSGTKQQLSTVTRNNRTFWFIERKGQYLSAEKKGIISNSVMFLASAGLSDQVTNIAIDSDNYLAQLLTNYVQLVSKQFIGFQSRMRSLAAVNYKEHLKYSGVAVVGLVVGYFALTSWYLDIRLNSAKADAQIYSEKTKDVFEIKAQLNEVQSKLQQILTVNDKVGAPNIIWRLIVPLSKQGVLFSQIGMLPNGTYIVRAQADKATDVLEFISLDSVVIEPQFQGQTSTIKVNGKDKEQFAIAFKIKQGA
jgi:hypothetical protein